MMLTPNQVEDLLREAWRRSPRRVALHVSEAVLDAKSKRDPKRRRNLIVRRQSTSSKKSYYDGPIIWDAWASPSRGRQRGSAPAE